MQAKQAKEVKEITPDLLRLIAQMEVAMEKNQGVGLAAPQINISKQIIVIKDGGENTKNHAFLIPRFIKKAKNKKPMKKDVLVCQGSSCPLREQRVSISLATQKKASLLLLKQPDWLHVFFNTKLTIFMENSLLIALLHWQDGRSKRNWKKSKKRAE